MHAQLLQTVAQTHAAELRRRADTRRVAATDESRRRGRVRRLIPGRRVLGTSAVRLSRA